jgi:hypothetical protein
MKASGKIGSNGVLMSDNIEKCFETGKKVCVFVRARVHVCARACVCVCECVCECVCVYIQIINQI